MCHTHSCLASQNRPAKFRPSWLTGDSCNSVPIFMGIVTLCLESQASMYIIYTTVYTMLYVWPTWTLESQPVTFSSALKKSGDYRQTGWLWWFNQTNISYRGLPKLYSQLLQLSFTYFFKTWQIHQSDPIPAVRLIFVCLYWPIKVTPTAEVSFMRFWKIK